MCDTLAKDFHCTWCDTHIRHTLYGRVTGCEHYPAEWSAARKEILAGLHPSLSEMDVRYVSFDIKCEYCEKRTGCEVPAVNFPVCTSYECDHCVALGIRVEIAATPDGCLPLFHSYLTASYLDEA